MVDKKFFDIFYNIVLKTKHFNNKFKFSSILYYKVIKKKKNEKALKFSIENKKKNLNTKFKRLNFL